jgi:hypothetical protein
VQGGNSNKKEAPGACPTPGLDEALGPETQHEVMTPNLARRPPQGTLPDVGDDESPAPIDTVTAWCVAAVPSPALARTSTFAADLHDFDE